MRILEPYWDFPLPSLFHLFIIFHYQLRTKQKENWCLVKAVVFRLPFSTTRLRTYSIYVNLDIFLLWTDLALIVFHTFQTINYNRRVTFHLDFVLPEISTCLLYLPSLLQPREQAQLFLPPTRHSGAYINKNTMEFGSRILPISALFYILLSWVFLCFFTGVKNSGNHRTIVQQYDPKYSKAIY